MALTIRYPWSGEEGLYADTVHEAQRPAHSPLLGPDGRPLAYERPPVGFDLRPLTRPASSPVNRRGSA